MNKRPVRVNSRFYIFIAVIVIVAIVVAVLLLSRDTGGELSEGSLRLDLDAKAVVIRSEQCISVDRYDRVTFSVQEGEEVFEGTPVATVFKWGYSDERLQSLLSTQAQIKDLQMSQLTGVENADLELITLQITQKQQAIRDCVMLDGGKDLLTLERELDALLAQRIAYLKNAVQPTEELNSLYSAEETKKAQIAEWNTVVTAPGTGTVSFYFDGYEQALTYDKIDVISAVIVNDALKNAKGTYGGASDELLYRLVNPNSWCIAFVTTLTAPQRTVGGETYTVIFGGFADRPYTGVAMEPVISESGVVNIIKLEEDIGGLISIRSVPITLKAEMQGVEVPLAAISMKDGVAYVTVEDGDTGRQIAVDVLSSDVEFAIVRPHEKTDTLYAGQRYLRP